MARQDIDEQMKELAKAKGISEQELASYILRMHGIDPNVSDIETSMSEIADPKYRYHSNYWADKNAKDAKAKASYTVNGAKKSTDMPENKQDPTKEYWATLGKYIGNSGPSPVEEILQYSEPRPDGYAGPTTEGPVAYKPAHGGKTYKWFIAPEDDKPKAMPTVGEMLADGSIKKETKKKEPSAWSRFSNWISENANADEERNARAREAIAKSWNDYRDRTDPWFRTGLVNAIFGDSSMLNGYYNAMNSNAEAEKNRALQEKINEATNKSSGSSIEDALNKKENQKWLDEQGYPALDDAYAAMEEQANSTGLFTPGDITPSTVAKFVNTAKAIVKKGGDVSKYEHLLNIDEDGNIVSFNYDALKADPNKPKGTKEVKAERDAFLAGIKQRIQNMNVFLKNNPKEKAKYNAMYKSIQDEIQSEMDNGATDIDMSWLGARSKDKPPKTQMETMKAYASGVKRLTRNKDDQRVAMKKKFPNATDADITEALK